MRIEACKINHLINPLGFALPNPTFSWIVCDAQGKQPQCARIIVKCAEAVVADTGWAQLDSLCARIPLALRPRTRYTWTVSVRSDAQEEAQSAENWFETGKMDEPWQAQWIGCDDSEPRLPIFSKQIVPRGTVAAARLYICGLGLYEARWNGEKIGDEFMTPYCGNYNAWTQYQTYDITPQLQHAGTLVVELGNGWYKGRFCFRKDLQNYYGNSWKLLAEVRLTYADGSEESIATDESWQVTRSCIAFSNIYDGEQRDDTLAALAPAPACRVDAPAGRLMERLSTPVRIRQERKGKLLHTPAGETVLDVEQNMTGTFRLRVNEPRGTRVHLQFGEILQNGNFYNKNLRTAKAEYWYVSDGQEHEIIPKFTFYGFRYVKIEGATHLTADDFTALVLYSELPQTGTLQTGNALVNQLIHNAEWGQLGNFLDVPTDCPQRDERMGWTGDAQVFAPTACFQRDSYAFLAKYLYDMYTEQLAHQGEVPPVVPSFGLRESSSAWGDAACVIPWVLYTYYGDASILEAQFDSMCAWVDFMERLERNQQGWRNHFHFGDWLALDYPSVTGSQNGTQGGTDKAFIALVYFRLSAQLTARAAAVLGKAPQAAHYQALADELLAIIRAEYFTATGRCAVPTQTALALSLHHGIAPDIQRTQRDLRKKMLENHGMLQTGFVGTPLLCATLTANGAEDVAFGLLLNEEYPGWLYEVKLGATTIWERWNSVLPDGTISGTSMNSLNHYAYGSVVDWLYRDVAGIAPAAPGFKRAVLHPHFCAALGYAEARYQSAAGIWEVSWHMQNDGQVCYRCTVPFGCTAELTLPVHGTLALTAGSYEYTFQVDTK